MLEITTSQRSFKSVEDGVVADTAEMLALTPQWISHYTHFAWCVGSPLVALLTGSDESPERIFHKFGSRPKAHGGPRRTYAVIVFLGLPGATIWNSIEMEEGFGKRHQLVSHGTWRLSKSVGLLGGHAMAHSSFMPLNTVAEKNLILQFTAVDSEDER